jgi:glycosyltransferase involved in cell wall biosynthesis
MGNILVFRRLSLVVWAGYLSFAIINKRRLIAALAPDIITTRHGNADTRILMRLLYVQPGLVPPPKDKRMDKMYYVPAPVCGDILLPTWAREKDEIRTAVGENSYPGHIVNNFTYHIYLAGKYAYGDPRQKVCIFWFFFREGLCLLRSRKYDCILTYGWGLTGLTALILHYLTGVKLIVELGGAPHHSYQFGGYDADKPKKTIGMRVMKVVSDFLLHVVLSSATRVQLRYPSQLSEYPRLQSIPASIVHGFVPVSRVPFTGESDRSILLVGAPWYLKGVDILIRAFQQIQADFPDVTLRLLGYFPNQQTLNELIGNNPRIEILKARPNAETLAIIANCEVFVLASRTEAGARVLIEAMAAGKPLIASNVDGNPHYVNDGVNGFLFEKENVDDLAGKLRLLLSSPELRKQMGDAGYKLAKTKYAEAAFGEEFAKMVELTANPSSNASAAAESFTASLPTGKL